MRNAFLLLALLSAAVFVPAQQVIPGPAKSAGCPIGFSTQVNGRAIARTPDDQKKNGGGPLLELAFGHLDALKVVSATVTVHGLSPSSRYPPGLDENATQTFELRPENGATDLTNAEVWLNKILSVSWVELAEMKYSDGSAWHASSDVQCRAVPGKRLLVDATATPRAQR
jgi:hypothetical protein